MRELQWKDRGILVLKRQLENLAKLVKFYKKKSEDKCSEDNTDTAVPVEFDVAIQGSIQSLVSSDRRYCWHHDKWKGQLIADAVFNQGFLGGCNIPYLLAKAKLWLRQNVFLPWKILKAMDLTGSSLNHKGLEVLREEENGGKKYYH